MVAETARAPAVTPPRADHDEKYTLLLLSTTLVAGNAAAVVGVSVVPVADVGEGVVVTR